MPRNWGRWAWATAAAAAAALCASGTVSAGPVTAAGAWICMPWPDDGLATVGQWLPNHGPGTVTLTHVALREPVGVAVVEASLMANHQVPGGGSLGMDFGPHPPSFDPADGSPELADEWAQRLPAVGAQIPAGEVRALIFGVRRTTEDRPATLRGFDVTYVDGGRSHRVVMDGDIMLGPDVQACEAWAER
ncbi:hypothetical protein [Jiangella mangrovi]|uniref:Copper(I)-binding protein n=1 Tax=Jiangella mangrovi TaxID=1524084 RepID=A0A7W9GS78_9ACTN|nr:hypothetical protein [Jiangella mangrovi]MBB5789094.1 copper(I)-binding protein [Jiangella mangrovi]